jgi:hypothetical protein
MMLGLRRTLTTPNKPLLALCGVLSAACFISDQGIAQIKKVDGYDGYKFGMTIDEALKVKSAAKKKTPCDYRGVPVCLEYATTVSAFPARVTVQFQFDGNTPLLSQILLTVRSSLDDPVRYPCRDVGKEVLKLLVAKYGERPMIKDHEATWTSPDGGSVSLLALCVDDFNGLNVISYRPSSPL